jgi:hypothetical protein
MTTLYQDVEAVELTGSADELAATIAARHCEKHSTEEPVRLLVDPSRKRPRIDLTPRGQLIRVPDKPDTASESTRIPEPHPALGNWAQEVKRQAEERAKRGPRERRACVEINLTAEELVLLQDVADRLGPLFATRREEEARANAARDKATREEAAAARRRAAARGNP